jgi:hypothetical protein
MIRRRFYRSSAIIATSLAAMVPKPYVKAATKKEKKETRTATVAKSAQKPGGAGDPPRSPSTLTTPSVLKSSGLNEPFTPLIPSPYGPITPLGPTKPAPAPVPQMLLTDKGPYPWRENIVTTTFWIGETAAKNNPVPNDKSSWDVNWAKNYGGTDAPEKSSRSGFLPVAFTPGQNPFYVALPYNDVQKGGHKPEASQVIPWFKREFKGSGKSVLKGRWIAIRFKDRIAYAQWEDCGPFRTDHYAYVFGNERPKPNLNKGAGLDVSPAVRDYLGMASTDVTDWKFVEFEEVPRGPWSTHGENNTFVLKDRIDTVRVAEGLKTQPPAPVRGPSIEQIE